MGIFDFTPAAWTYIVLLFIWILIFVCLDGLNLVVLNNFCFLMGIFVLGCIFFIGNLVLLRYTHLKSQDDEYEIFTFVQQNQNYVTAIGITLAVAIFAAILSDKRNPFFRLSLVYALLGFGVVLLGAIVVIWVPDEMPAFINWVRHLKSGFYILGSLLILAGIAIIIDFQINADTTKTYGEFVSEGNEFNYVPENEGKTDSKPEVEIPPVAPFVEPL